MRALLRKLLDASPFAAKNWENTDAYERAYTQGKAAWSATGLAAKNPYDPLRTPRGYEGWMDGFLDVTYAARTRK